MVLKRIMLGMSEYKSILLSGDLEFGGGETAKKIGVEVERLLKSGIRVAKVPGPYVGIVAQGRPDGEYVLVVLQWAKEEYNSWRGVEINAILGLKSYALEWEVSDSFPESPRFEFTVGEVTPGYKRKLVQNELLLMCDRGDPGSQKDLASLLELLSKTTVDPESTKNYLAVLLEGESPEWVVVP